MSDLALSLEFECHAATLQHVRMVYVGPSSISREQLLQKLVQDFPKAFQLVDRLSTPAYGHDAPADTSVSQPQQPGSSGIVSPAEFKVRFTMLCKSTSLHAEHDLSSPSATNNHLPPLMFLFTTTNVVPALCMALL